MTVSDDEYEAVCEALQQANEDCETLRKMIGMYRGDKAVIAMREALERIWEMDPDEPYETIRAMQHIALNALKVSGFTLCSPFEGKDL